MSDPANKPSHPLLQALLWAAGPGGPTVPPNVPRPGRLDGKCLPCPCPRLATCVRPRQLGRQHTARTLSRPGPRLAAHAAAGGRGVRLAGAHRPGAVPPPLCAQRSVRCSAAQAEQRGAQGAAGRAPGWRRRAHMAAAGGPRSSSVVSMSTLRSLVGMQAALLLKAAPPLCTHFLRWASPALPSSQPSTLL